MSLLASTVLKRSSRKKEQQLRAHAYLQGHCCSRQVWVRSVCTLPWSMPGSTCAALLPLPSTLSGGVSPPLSESGATWPSVSSRQPSAPLLLPSLLMLVNTELGSKHSWFHSSIFFCAPSAKARESPACETQSSHLFSFTGRRKKGRSYVLQQLQAQHEYS